MLSLSILGFVRFFVIPYFDESLKMSGFAFTADLSVRLLSTLMVTVAIATFIFWLTPDLLAPPNIQVIEARMIGPLLQEAMTKTHFWFFKGSSGRYLRSKTLPVIAAHARSTNVSKDITALLLDPNNEQLCSDYANYRRGLKSAFVDEPWTALRVKQEAYATILTLVTKQQEEPLLRITVALTNHFSSFRVDLSSPYAIVTREEPTAPGVRCDSGSYFYDSYRDDIQLAIQQSRKIEQPKNIQSLVQLSPKSCRTLLISLGLPPSDLSDEDIDKILLLARNAKNPYG